MFPPYKDERKHVFMGMQIVKIFPYTSKQTRPHYDEFFKNRSIIYIYLLSIGLTVDGILQNYEA